MHHFSVIGNPIAHSKSPILFNSIFNQLKIDAHYKSDLLINNDDVREYIASHNTKTIKGINITMPFKEYCFSLVDDKDKIAETTKSINCIHFKNNKTIGYNNDYYGFIKLIESNQIKITDTNNIIIGSGGSARTIIFALIEKKAKSIHILSRNLKTATNIIEEFKSYAKNINLQIWNPSNTLQNCNLINCSPIGLSIQINNTILSQLTAKRYESIIDINYNIQKDYFNFNSNKKVDGKSMFIYQALKSLDIWFESNISNKLDYKYLEQLLC